MPNPYAPPGSYGPPGAPEPYGVPREAPGAKSALVCGIVSLLCCGVVMGPVAIVEASKAKRAIAMDPSLTGGGMATTGMILGIIAIALNVVGIILRLSTLR
jgi:hypothetical protein